MNVALNGELEEFVHGKVNSGSFDNVGDVVRAALRLMKDGDTERGLQRDRLAGMVDQGWEEARSGQLTTPHAAKAQLAEYKLRWMAQREPSRA